MTSEGTTPTYWELRPDYVEACRRTLRPEDPIFYEVPRPRGSVARDVTDFVPGQARWSIRNPPEIIYMLEPPPEWHQFRNWFVADARDINGAQMYEKWPRMGAPPRPLRDLPILPDRIGFFEEPWYFEAVQRLDPRVTFDDIMMRIEPSAVEESKTFSEFEEQQDKFRKEWSLLSWRTAVDEESPDRKTIMDRLVPAQISNNTTRGVTPGPIGSILGEDGGRVPLPGEEQESQEKKPSRRNTAATKKKTPAKPRKKTTAKTNTGRKRRNSQIDEAATQPAPPSTRPNPSLSQPNPPPQHLRLLMPRPDPLMSWQNHPMSGPQPPSSVPNSIVPSTGPIVPQPAPFMFGPIPPMPRQDLPVAGPEPFWSRPDPYMPGPPPPMPGQNPYVTGPAPYMAGQNPYAPRPTPSYADPRMWMSRPEPPAPGPAPSLAGPAPSYADPRSWMPRPEPSSPGQTLPLAGPAPSVAGPPPPSSQPPPLSPQSDALVAHLRAQPPSHDLSGPRPSHTSPGQDPRMGMNFMLNPGSQ